MFALVSPTVDKVEAARQAGVWLQLTIAEVIRGDPSPSGVEFTEGFVKFSVPGFGTFKVVNNVDRLEKLAKKFKSGFRSDCGMHHPCFSPKRMPPEESPQVSTRRVPISEKKWAEWEKDHDVQFEEVKTAKGRFPKKEGQQCLMPLT
jgi:hypothetical protein